MEVIETPWNRLGKFIELGFGIPFFIVGLFWFFQDRSVAFLYNGVLWIVVGLILLSKAKIDKYIIYYTGSQFSYINPSYC